MRKIKFRGLQALPLPGKQHFVYGCVTELNGPGEGIAMMDVGVHGERWQVLMDTVGQYTGLTDKNNTEIYEGDILSDGEDVCSVVFWNGSFCLNRTTDYDELSMCCIKDWEVVGNIHEHKEVL